MLTEDLSPEDLDKLKHAWGFSSKTPGYRNRYICEVDEPKMLSLVSRGWMERPRAMNEPILGADNGLFYVSEQGIRLLESLLKVKKVHFVNRRTQLHCSVLCDVETHSLTYVWSKVTCGNCKRQRKHYEDRGGIRWTKDEIELFEPKNS